MADKEPVSDRAYRRASRLIRSTSSRKTPAPKDLGRATLDGTFKPRDLGRHSLVGTYPKPYFLAKNGLTKAERRTLHDNLLAYRRRDPPTHTDGKKYRGQDAEREFQKSFGREYWRNRASIRSDPSKLNSVDQRAAYRVIEAGHSGASTQDAAANKGIGCTAKSEPTRKAYGKKLVDRVQRRPAIREYIQQQQKLKSQHGHAGDHRVQSTEIVNRKEAVINQKDPNSYDPLLQGDRRADAICRFNQQQRIKAGIIESPERRDIEGAKAFLPDHSKGYERSGKIVGRNSIVAAEEHYPPRQAAYGKLAAANGDASGGGRPSPEKMKHITHESHYDPKHGPKPDPSHSPSGPKKGR